MNFDSTAPLPLAGVRSLELAEIWAGPFCGVLLGDLGAEVIKVESIQRIARGPVRAPQGSAGYPDGDPGERPWNRAANFNGLNRNKLGLTLDLGDPNGADAFKELVSISDVVVSNYAYGVMTEKFGLDYETLRRVKPDIVMLLMPGFGNTGPYKRYRSMGMTIDALSGHSSQRGYPDLDLSTLSPVHHPDAVGGATAAFRGVRRAAPAQPHRRGPVHRHGAGGVVHPPHGRGGARVRHDGPSEGAARQPPPRHGAARSLSVRGRRQMGRPRRPLRSEWRAACAAMGAPALADDARFATLGARLANHDELDAIIADWTRGLDRHQAARLLQEAGVPAAAVVDCGADAYDDPHLAGAGLLPAGDAPGGGNVPAERPHVEAVGAGRSAPRAGTRPGGTQRPGVAGTARRDGCGLRGTGA